MQPETSECGSTLKIEASQACNVFFSESLATVAPATQTDMLIRVPPYAGTPRAKLIVGTDGLTRVTLQENPVVTADGTAIAPVNLNLESSVAPAVMTFSGPTSSDFGRKVMGQIVDAATYVFPNQVILNKATDYLLRINNIGTTSRTVSFAVSWTENH